MGKHSTKSTPCWLQAIAAHKGKILAALVVLIPLISRWVPGFPTDEVLQALRIFLGA